MPDEKEAMDAYAEAGVDLPELKVEQPEKEEAPKEEPKPEEEKPKAEETPEPLQEKETETERKPRSIYDEYKEKKVELKTERELREQAERERDEWKVKAQAVAEAKTPEEKEEAQDELTAFAKRINADPDAIREMRDLFIKDMKPATDESLAQDLQEFKAWKSQNSKLLEKQMFEDEYQATAPKLKDMLPNATAEEMQSVKKELDRLSHTKEFHDKDLEYVAWKNKETLSALISPKKRGLEPKGNADAQEESFDFDPNADYSKLTPKQREVWETEYKKLTASTDLMTDADGKKSIL